MEQIRYNKNLNMWSEKVEPITGTVIRVCTNPTLPCGRMYYNEEIDKYGKTLFSVLSDEDQNRVLNNALGINDSVEEMRIIRR